MMKTKVQRVQLNRWVLPETLDFVNNLAEVRGFKQGPMMDRIIDEYRDPPLIYLLEQILDKIPSETYFTDQEEKDLIKLRDMISGVLKL